MTAHAVRVRVWPALVLVCVLIAGAGAASRLAGVARADGDPASDVLVTQDVFLPYSGVSDVLERRLFSLTAAADRAGYPVKIALIASPADLGVVPALFNRPQAYARFLSAEIETVVRGPVLVVMPAGLGLAAGGHGQAIGAADTSARPGNAPAALARAALAAVPALATAAGHPFRVQGSAAATSAGASPGTIAHAATALLVLMVLALAAIAGAFVARTRRARVSA